MQLWMYFMEQYPAEYLLICAPSDANDMSNVLFETRPTWTYLPQEKFFSDSLGDIQYDYYQVQLDNTEIGLDNNYYALAA